MKEYAVIQIADKQYIVEPEKVYTVDKFVSEPGDKVKLEALAYAKDDTFETGTPTLSKPQVEIEVIGQGKGEKVKTHIFKAKSRYRRTRGHRKQVTTFKVLSIK